MTLESLAELPNSVTPAKAGVQKLIEKPGFLLPPESRQATSARGSYEFLTNEHDDDKMHERIKKDYGSILIELHFSLGCRRSI